MGTLNARKTRDDDTIQDLYRVPDHGKADLVEGRLALMSPVGGVPGRAAGRIYRSLDDYERSMGGGYAFPDNVGFLVDLPHRQSFSPDAAFWVGELPSGGQSLQGAPLFAAEVRSSTDYGPEADLLIAAKRTDYFAAGTLVAWDVDLLRDQEIRVYRASRPHQPDISGEVSTPTPSRHCRGGRFQWMSCLVLSCASKRSRPTCRIPVIDCSSELACGPEEGRIEGCV